MLSARQVGLVADQVFKESIRDRVLYSTAAFALLLVVVSLLLGEIAAGQEVKIIKDFGLATINVGGLGMAVVIGVRLVAREIECRSICGVMARPLARWEFIVGKYLGLVFTILVSLALMTTVFYALLAWIGWRAPEEFRRSWPAPAADPALLLALVLILAELALVTAVALFFSTFSSSAFLSMALTLGVWILGVESADLRRFGLTGSPAMSALALVGWALPAFSVFDVKAAVVHGEPVSPALVMWRLLYGGVYAAVLVGASIATFSRREFR